MSKIEESFWIANENFNMEIEKLDQNNMLNRTNLPISDKRLEHGVVIGPYKVDFVYGDYTVIELDGHEYHKTKEQRDHDYKRERYLQKLGYIVIRFTGTEVFLDARSCIIDMVTIHNLFEEKLIDAWMKGSES